MMRIDWHRLVTPSAWAQVGVTDWDYDAALNDALDRYGVSHIENYTVSVGSKVLWIGNYPYSYGHIYSGSNKALPSVKTRKRLKKMITEKVAAEWSDYKW